MPNPFLVDDAPTADQLSHAALTGNALPQNPTTQAQQSDSQPGAVKRLFTNYLTQMGKNLSEDSEQPPVVQGLNMPQADPIQMQQIQRQQMLNNVMQSQIQGQSMPQLAPKAPSALHQRLVNGLQGFSDAMAAYAHIPTQFQRQQDLIKNQQAQQGINIQQQNADTNQGYKDLQGQQYGMVTVNDADGNPIQIQAKDAGRFASSMAGVQQRQQAKEQAAQIALASKGFKMVTDANGKMSIQPMSPQEQSDFLKSQQAKNTGAANQSNARAAAIPQQLQINQQNANSQSSNAATNRGGLNLKQQEFQAKYGAPQQNPDGSLSTAGTNFRMLSAPAQKVLMESAPIKQQLIELRDRIDKLGLANNNDSGYLAKSRALYAIGQASDEGSLAEDISKMDMARIVGSARILKGSSRAYQALETGMKHMPNSWIDSPKLMKQKLNSVIDNLDGIEQDAVKYGNKSGLTPVPTPASGGKKGDPLGILK